MKNKFSVALFALLFIQTAAWSWTKERHIANPDTSILFLENRLKTFTMSQAATKRSAAQRTNNSDKGFTTSYYAPEWGLVYVDAPQTGLTWRAGIHGFYFVQAVPFKQKLSTGEEKFFTPNMQGGGGSVSGLIGYAYSDVYFMVGLSFQAIFVGNKNTWKYFAGDDFVPDYSSPYAGIAIPIQVGYNIPIHRYFFMQVYAEVLLPLRSIDMRSAVKSFNERASLDNLAILHEAAAIGFGLGVPF